MKYELLSTKIIDRAWKFNFMDLDSEDNKISALVYVLRTILLVSNPTGQLILMLNPSTEFAKIILTAAFFSEGIVCVFQFIYAILVRKRLRRLLIFMDTEFPKNNHSDDLKRKYCRKANKYAMNFYLISAVSCILTPIGYYINPEEKVAKDSLLYLAEYPWTIESHLSHFLTCLYQLVAVAQAPMAVYATTVLIAMCTIEFKFQFEELLSEISNSDEKLRPPSGNERLRTSQLADILYGENVKQCMRKYQVLCRGFVHFKGCFRTLFALQIIHSILFISCIVASVSKVTEAAYYFFMFALMILNSTSTYLLCYAGQIFFEFNQKVGESLYNLDWFQASAANQKITLMFITSCKRPMRLTAWHNLYAANLDFFAAFLQLTYKYINMIKSTI